MAPEICVESLFVCRGKERLQVLVGSPVSHQFPLRKTTSTHRQTGEIHSADIEDWHNMTRSHNPRHRHQADPLLDRRQAQGHPKNSCPCSQKTYVDGLRHKAGTVSSRTALMSPMKETHHRDVGSIREI